MIIVCNRVRNLWVARVCCRCLRRPFRYEGRRAWHWPWVKPTVVQAMEGSGTECVLVGFFGRLHGNGEQGESYGKNSNEAHSSDLMNQNYNHRGQDKETLMYEPLFDSPLRLLAFIQRCHLSIRCVFVFISPKSPSETLIIREFNHLTKTWTLH